MKNRICVYAIAKNESKFVDKWYESMKEADEIVVLDTGSTDDTVSKLRAHGVKVEVKEIKPWRFDVARNESMKLIPEDCNILVCTDLDEVLSPGWAEILRSEWVEGKHTRAVYKYNWSHYENGEPAVTFIYNKIHDRDWIWKYPVHELLYNTKTQKETYPEDGELNLFDKITLDHWQDLEKSRSSYLGLLELREQEDDGTDLYGKLYLGHEYYYRDMPEKSISVLKQALETHDTDLWDIEKASCWYYIGMNHYNQKNYEEATMAYLKGMKIDPTYRECYIGAARAYIELGQYGMAVAAIRDCLRKTWRHYSWLENDISWGYEPYDLLCQAYFNSGEYLKALGCGYKALTMDEHDPRLNHNVLAALDNLTDEDY